MFNQTCVSNDGTTVRDGVLKPVDIDSNFAIKF